MRGTPGRAAHRVPEGGAERVLRWRPVPLPRVAIVGRPNVGKSSLLNRLVGRRVSIVDPTPGVTRDRVTALLEVYAPIDTPRGTPARLVELVDTGGYGVYVAEGKRYDDVGADLATLTPDIEAQIAAARAEADLVLFVVDAQSGLTALDRTVARLLREEGNAAKIVVVANKVDGPSWESHGLETAGLGLGEPLLVSAETGHGLRGLQDQLWALAGDVAGAPEADAEIRLAIIGRRNAGKSTLINTLAGAPRVIVSEIAGTTRDAVDVRIEIEGHRLLAIDTAGLRKRKSFADDIEYYAAQRMLGAIRRADVVLLMLDAAETISQVDKRLAMEMERQYKPVIIVVNKLDLIPRDDVGPDAFEEYITKELPGLDFAPIAFICARTGEGVRDLIAMAINLHQQACHREPTAGINRAVERIMKERGPSSKLGRQAKLYFASQVTVQPPTIVIKVNNPSLFDSQYERYLINRLREELPFSEVPIRLLFTLRERDPIEAVKARGRRRAGDVMQVDDDALAARLRPEAVDLGGDADLSEGDDWDDDEVDFDFDEDDDLHEEVEAFDDVDDVDDIDDVDTRS